MSKITQYASLGGLLAVLCFTSTGVTAAEKEASKVSGYLGPEVYALLEEVQTHDDTTVKRWVGPKLSFANYKKVLIEDVILFPEPHRGPR